MNSVSYKKSSSSQTLTASSKTIISKHRKGSSLDNIDIVAIHEWLESQEGVELFNSLRAIALLCNIVDGLDELFFQIAKELPAKIGFKDFVSEEIEIALVDNGIESFHPLDYVKTVQELFKNSEYSKEFVCDLEESIFTEQLGVLQKRFKIVSKEEYQELLNGIVTKDSQSKEEVSQVNIQSCSTFDELVKYANNIKFRRTILIKSDDEEVF
jgi:hypothetical protein